MIHISGIRNLDPWGEKISGTSKVGWDTPDTELLDFIKKIVDENQFWSQAIDLFYHNKKRLSGQ